ncbi:MAG TPA: nitrogen fixation protein NifS [Providencia sp.]|uniref:nitrogen fixation protein NifS n=1 Tax=Providencia sp. TaxID=589 RepID=UPI000E7E1BA5|nr:nitrogen fixation protein NifS [Providencia sp.]MBP6079848.1 nitrogen fixation protein NifS [Providencia sp.]HBO23647.1 nitrogen fixation protein NifS [Providencia sp.]
MGKKIFLIHNPSPTLGRVTYPWVNGSSIVARYLSGNTVDNYLSALQKEIDVKNLDWKAYCDDTESDIEKLISQNADLLVCVPGLKYQFNETGFDKNNIIYLSTMEYANNVTTAVISKIVKLDNRQ